MKKKKSTWPVIAIIVLVIILVANFTPLSYILHENYFYTNYDKSFMDSEEAGGTSAFKTVRYDYRDFLMKSPDKKAKDSTLYRTFTIKPWRFWQWSDYIFCVDRFKLPYKQP